MFSGSVCTKEQVDSSAVLIFPALYCIFGMNLTIYFHHFSGTTSNVDLYSKKSVTDRKCHSLRAESKVEDQHKEE